MFMYRCVTGDGGCRNCLEPDMGVLLWVDEDSVLPPVGIGPGWCFKGGEVMGVYMSVNDMCDSDAKHNVSVGSSKQFEGYNIVLHVCEHRNK